TAEWHSSFMTDHSLRLGVRVEFLLPLEEEAEGGGLGPDDLADDSNGRRAVAHHPDDIPFSIEPSPVAFVAVFQIESTVGLYLHVRQGKSVAPPSRLAGHPANGVTFLRLHRDRASQIAPELFTKLFLPVHPVDWANPPDDLGSAELREPRLHPDQDRPFRPDRLEFRVAFDRSKNGWLLAPADLPRLFPSYSIRLLVGLIGLAITGSAEGGYDRLGLHRDHLFLGPDHPHRVNPSTLDVHSNPDNLGLRLQAVLGADEAARLDLDGLRNPPLRLFAHRVAKSGIEPRGEPGEGQGQVDRLDAVDKPVPGLPDNAGRSDGHPSQLGVAAFHFLPSRLFRQPHREYLAGRAIFLPPGRRGSCKLNGLRDRGQRVGSWARCKGGRSVRALADQLHHYGAVRFLQGKLGRGHPLRYLQSEFAGVRMLVEGSAVGELPLRRHDHVERGRGLEHTGRVQQFGLDSRNRFPLGAFARDNSDPSDSAIQQPVDLNRRDEEADALPVAGAGHSDSDQSALGVHDWAAAIARIQVPVDLDDGQLAVIGF